MNWKGLWLITLAALVSACGESKEEPQDETIGKKFDQAIEEAKQKLEKALEEEGEE